MFITFKKNFWDALATIIAILVFIFSVFNQYQTNKYLDRQHAEEVLKTRAYVGTAINQESLNPIQYKITNFGLTPAKNLKVVTTIFYNNGKSVKPDDMGTKYTILNPSQSFLENINVSKINSSEVVRIESHIEYNDYTGISRYNDSVYTRLNGSFVIEKMDSDSN